MDKVTRETVPQEHVKPPAPILRFDWTDWLPYLEDQDIPDEQKRALIETLWGIVVAFVDLGWQLDAPTKTSGEVLDLHAILTSMESTSLAGKKTEAPIAPDGIERMQ